MPSLHCNRCISGLLTHLIFLSALFSNTSEIIDSDDDENNSSIDIFTQPLEKYYFTHEIDFLARQAMILGNYYHETPDNDKTTQISPVKKKIDRLRFIEKSLQIELEYIRKMRTVKKNTDDFLADTTVTENVPADTTGMDNIIADTTSTTSATSKSTDSSDEVKTCIREKKILRPPREIIFNTISEATWSTCASPPSTTLHLPEAEIEAETEKKDQKYDFDWVVINGFAWHHDKLDCSSHAYDQHKSFYTPEMWRQLWKTYRDSTLFPFPIPNPEEIPKKPFHVNRTTDGKGRGNFASRNITKGSLVYHGLPSTVFFVDANSWYRFITSLPKMMACDAMEWAWEQDLTNTGNVVMCMNLDEAVFFNDGGWDSSTNMAVKEATSLNYYATEDVEIGKELVYDYSRFDFEPEEMNL